MTREQIGVEKVALQKALLYYESIHGRPVSHPRRINTQASRLFNGTNPYRVPDRRGENFNFIHKVIDSDA